MKEASKTREETCCFTGHRKIPEEEREQLARRLEATVEELIRAGVRYFVAGGALGFDTLAAQTILKLRTQYSQVKLILVLPCETQTRGWPEEDVRIYEEIKKAADDAPYALQVKLQEMELAAPATLEVTLNEKWDADRVLYCINEDEQLYQLDDAKIENAGKDAEDSSKEDVSKEESENEVSKISFQVNKADGDVYVLLAGSSEDSSEDTQDSSEDAQTGEENTSEDASGNDSQVADEQTESDGSDGSGDGEDADLEEELGAEDGDETVDAGE